MADAAQEDKLAAWWVKWREADFTWAGLAQHDDNKRLQGWVVADGVLREAENGRIYGQPILETPQPVEGPPATLQDYWRADPATGRLRSDAEMGDELVHGDGQPTYHRAHLPLAYADGTPTGKEAWADDALDALVHSRLKAASETVWEGAWHDRTITGPDRDAQLQGGIWLKAATHPADPDHPLSLRHDLALVVRYCSFAYAKFSGDARFQGAAFSGEALFHGAAFSGVAWFQGAAFSGVARFDGAAFSGVAWFQGAAFSGVAGFQGAAFSGAAWFQGAAFSGAAWFQGAAFSGVARFQGAAFSGDAWFQRAAFSGGAGFQGAAFSGVAGFEGAAFSGAAWFQRAAFSRDARFEGAAFSGAALFDGAAFSGAARFDGAAFSGAALFDGAAFSGDARFEGAAFTKLASFTDARFAKAVSFARLDQGENEPPKPVTFSGKAAFARALFEGVPTFDHAVFQGDMDFTAAVFDKLASFENIIWPAEGAHWHSAFDQALFRGTLSLYGAGLQKFAAFDGATFERGVQIDEPESEGSVKRIFHAERKAALAAVDEKNTKDTRLRQLERGCRVLKQAFEKSSDKAREQILYRFELQARRAQSKLPPGEKLFSSLYALASDYGASMVRPFVALGVVIFGFAAVYWLCGVGVGIEPMPVAIVDGAPRFAAFDGNKASQAVEFSLINTFRPLSALSADGFREGTLGARLLSHNDPTALGVRALSILQSLFAIVLAFLFALAVRRRFQIS